MRVRDDCFVKYCRAKKEKLKMYMEYKVLRNQVKMKTKQDKKTFPGFIPKKKKKKKIYQSHHLLCCQRRNVLHAP